MDAESGSDADPELTVEAIRAAPSLAKLRAAADASDDQEVYFTAKRRWGAHWDGADYPPPETAASTGVPGETVVVDGRPIHVHGITHAATDAEESFLRPAVERWTADGAAVYCEQGVRTMYFPDLSAVCTTDDYRWALARTRALEVNTTFDGPAPFDGLAEGLDSLSKAFRDAAFSLLDGVVGDREGLAETAGAVAATFLTSHEDAAVGEDFASFRLTRAAAEDPGSLSALQAHYRRSFLPQPIEREWLRRHDPELELVTHARNERLADYALAHAQTGPVHLIVGAAHQPGVAYYLRRHRDGDRDLTGFELVD